MPEHRGDAAREAPALTRAYLALSASYGRTVSAAELPEALTGLLTQLQQLTRDMNADFSLILGLGYSIHTGGERQAARGKPEERPLAELSSARASAGAGALAVFLAHPGAGQGAPQTFTAAAADLLAALVEIADRLGTDFEACLMASHDDPQ
ncbi:hypothetical protein [Streptomyces sp. RKAG337]|uniref:hypothetical protein n=1 Tax=Streptomyces sp. RKAG337 TaxID=2893404 RepID=UPI0020336AF8|nr:hypothetical protein [Streptomyces sp. RKAG337]MCM2430927.1 hypothetical protein [Streptomyces sp. RKAG337]